MGLRQQAPFPPRGSVMAYSVRSAVYRLRGVLVYSTALVLLASPAFAQGQSADASAQSSTSPQDFRLGRPHGSIGVRGSFVMASADSDIFDFVTDVLAIEKSD